MNKEIFNQLIKKPANVGPEHKDNLKKLVDTFPYATNIRLLYLSSLLNDADVIFEQELKKTAAYISDRSVLKKIISNNPPKQNYIIKETILKVVPEETESKNSNSGKEKNITQKKLDNPNTTEVPNNDDTVKKLNDFNQTNEKSSENTQEINQSSTKKEDNKSMNELDNLIVSSAIGASISIDIDKVSNEINKAKNSPKSFLEWIEASEVKEVKPKLSLKQKERFEFKERAEILINQFIQNQPKIKPKAEFYSPENMARKSIEDSEEIVTETLAKVYAAQGNIAKAKSIYNQLILKNPEKKSYFASLINDLRSE